MEKKYNITTPENVAPKIFARLKDNISSLYPHDRYVALAFEHTPLLKVAPHLFASTSEKPARKYQPIACLFWNGTEEKCLADLLHVYMNALNDARARVVATVCPAESYFINVVQQMTRINDLFIHNGPIIFSTQGVKDIIHIFDPPNLLKTMRNLYTQHQILFKYMDVTRVSSWRDLEVFYELTDHKNTETCEARAKYLSPTQEELNCTAYAAKVFSKTFAMHLIGLALNFEENRDSLTAASDLCQFFNNIFDSFNASDFFSEDAPLLRNPVTKHSLHMEIWNNALDLLESMRILIPKQQVENVSGNLSGNHTDNLVQGHTPPSTQTNKSSDKKRKKKLQKKNGNDEKVNRTKTEKNVEAISENLNNLTLQKEVDLEDIKMTDDPENEKFLEHLFDPRILQATHLPPIHYWKLNVMGIKVLVDKLFKLRFKKVNTKIFNVDNVHSFFNVIRMLNKNKLEKFSHEDIDFEIDDEPIAIMCLKPSATYSLVPNENLITSSTTTSSTATTSARTSKK